MICPICKEITNDDTKFCTKCGRKIPRCPTCGKVVETRARFCVGDGTQLPAEVLELLPETDAPKAVPTSPKPKAEARKPEPPAVPSAPEKPPVRREPAPRRSRFCIQCGGPCEDDQTVCAKCRGQRPVPPVTPQPPRRAYCIRCGKPCAEGKQLCVECRSSDRSAGRYQNEKKKGSRTAIVMGVIALVVLLLIGVVLFFIFRDTDDAPEKEKEPASTISSWKNKDEDEDSIWRGDEQKDVFSGFAATEPAPVETEPLETAPVIETEPPTEAPTEPTVDVNSVEYRLEYFINYCSSEYFLESYFEGFDAEDCRLARNAIYAHSGRMFNDTSLQAFYEQFDWYEPRIDPGSFDSSMLNDCQLANVNAILSFEAAHGFN